MAGAIMETQHVRYFLAICEELSFTRAAQKCGIKQPTLSEAIKKMELAMGCKLFVRALPVRLTKLGFQLQPSACKSTSCSKTLALCQPHSKS